MITLLLGGPAYRMEVDARHAAFLVTFALRAAMPRIVAKKVFGGRLRHVVQPSPITIVGTHYEHGVPVEMARNSMFESALAQPDITHLLWLDADSAIPPDQCDAIISALIQDGASPILIVPSQQREGGICNVWESREKKLTVVRLDGEIRPCFAGGFGCVIFDLRWYRANWPAAPWFQSGWDPELAAIAGAKGYIGEDYGHCRALAERGATINYLGAYVAHHPRGSASAPSQADDVPAVGVRRAGSP